jgi:DNA (cytosine-5)-methyltransferase 1
MDRDTIRMFDLFCGGGGSSRGALVAGATPVAALDMWKLAADTYKLNFPDAKVYRMKASSLSRQRLLKEIGEIDLLIASPECTSHSVAKGKRPQREESQATAFEVIRYARTLRPRWIVVENVLQMQRWSRFDDWYHRLKELGYNLKTAILDAQYFDTPQSRRRFFVVGDLKTVPFLPKQGRRTERTVASILGHGEPRRKRWGFSLVKTRRRASATVERAERAIRHLGWGVPFIMVYYGTDGAGGFQTLDRPLRTVTTLDRFAYVRLNGLGYEMRMLQPPELAAAMGFPDYHIWPESARRNRIKLIGNAVCPTVMRAVVEALVKKSEISH